jgi:hypothetical protein
MRCTNQQTRWFVIWLLVFAALIGTANVEAQPICSPSNTLCVGSGSINMFRDSRGANDLGFTPGERFQFGANVVGGSLGTTLGAIYHPPSGFTVSQNACDPLAVNPNFCSRSSGFSLDRLAEPWTLIFQKDGAELRVSAPPLLGVNSDAIMQPVPFPVDVTITGSGTTTPTISWTVPDAFVPDGFRVNIYDRVHLGPTGEPDLIHSKELANTATSYTLPPVFEDSGLSVVNGGLYTIGFQLVETRNHVPFVSNANILRRSNSFFSFSLLPDSAPPHVALPTSIDGVYNFKITQVGPDSVTFIDPPVAIGYDYATGTGDPNFKTVRLPNAGDNLFDLYIWNGSSYDFHATVGSNVDFDFLIPGGAGVNRFRVLGIEPAAGLDPGNATAFITGLKFVSTGQFTGTMAPIVSETVDMELKPGSGPDCINPNSKGNVPVAIYGDSVNVNQINLSSLAIDDDSNPFTAGVAPVKTAFADVDGDGAIDLVLHFNTQQLGSAGLLGDSKTLQITGLLNDGTLINASDVMLLSNSSACR